MREKERGEVKGEEREREVMGKEKESERERS